MELVLEPVGYVTSFERDRFLASPQPEGVAATGSFIELRDRPGLEVALDGLAGFSRVWLIWWFHKSQGWRPKVLPPRGRGGRQGVFATRAPHRPNPLGLSSVPLVGVEGRKIYLGDHDLVDQTPILDIKPYLSRFDAHCEESSGWFAEVERQLDSKPDYRLQWSELAARQVAWLEHHYHSGFGERIRALLEVDPWPHRTRRIVPYENGFRLATGPWRVFFSVWEKTVKVERLTSGYQRPQDELHRRFQDLF